MFLQTQKQIQKKYLIYLNEKIVFEIYNQDFLIVISMKKIENYENMNYIY